MRIKKEFKRAIQVGAIAALTSFAAYGQTTCSKDSSGAITSTTDCFLQPDAYFTTVYRLGLCTAQPTAPTTSAAFNAANSCVTVFDNPSGTRMQVIKGTVAALPGTVSRPPNATYTHGYFIADTQFEVKAQATFSSPRVAIGNVNYNGATPVGNACWTTAGTTYTYSSNSPIANGKGYPFTCGASVATSGVDAYANAIVKLNSLAGGGQPTFGSVPVTYSKTFTSSTGTTTVYLVNGTNLLGSTAADNSSGDVQRVIGVVPMNVSVSNATTNMNLSFNVTNGALLTMFTGSGITGGIVLFGNAPLDVNLSVK